MAAAFAPEIAALNPHDAARKYGAKTMAEIAVGFARMLVAHRTALERAGNMIDGGGAHFARLVINDALAGKGTACEPVGKGGDDVDRLALALSAGEPLDAIGRLRGLERGEGEPDVDFRARIERQHAAEALGIPSVAKGYRRQWLYCPLHGRYGYHDYVPYGLSTAVGVMPCGCDSKSGRPVDEARALAVLAWEKHA